MTTGTFANTIRPTRQWANRFARSVADLIYPPVCRACGGAVEDDDELVCRSCWHDVTYVTGSTCAACGSPHGTASTEGACEFCPPDWPDRALLRSAVTYDGPVPALVHGLKFQGQTALVRPLGRWLIWGYDKNFGKQAFDWIVPVPLHRRRERSREYNQSMLLAHHLSSRTGLPIEDKTLVRWRHTLPQSSLTARVRLQNVIGAFRVRDASVFSGRRILAVDDVATTGSTASEVARVLLEVGAAQVSFLTVARGTP